MIWEDEPYVRVYTRDTPAWGALPFEARLLFYEIVRKVDHAGALEYRGDADLAKHLAVPLDFLRAGLPALFDDGCIEPIRSGRSGLIIPNFYEAQTARRSDRARQSERRRRLRDKHLGADSVTERDSSESPSHNVTLRDGRQFVTQRDTSSQVTERDMPTTRDAVTDRDTYQPSRNVTGQSFLRDVSSRSQSVTHSSPSEASQSHGMSRQIAGARAHARVSAAEQSRAEQSFWGERERGSQNVTADQGVAMDLWREEQRLRSLLGTEVRAQPRLGELDRIQAAIGRGMSVDDGMHVLHVRFGQAAHDKGKIRYLEPATLWGAGLEHAMGRDLAPEERRALDRLEGKPEPARRSRPAPAPPPPPKSREELEAEWAGLDEIRAAFERDCGPLEDVTQSRTQSQPGTDSQAAPVETPEERAAREDWMLANMSPEARARVLARRAQEAAGSTIEQISAVGYLGDASLLLGELRASGDVSEDVAYGPQEGEE